MFNSMTTTEQVLILLICLAGLFAVLAAGTLIAPYLEDR